MERKCRVCGLSITEGERGEYCPDHAQAVKSLREGYSIWKSAYGQISTEDYLGRLLALDETGERVKETARFFQQNRSAWERS